MKRFFIIFLIIACIIILIVGNLYWNKKTTIHVNGEAAEIVEKETNGKNEKAPAAPSKKGDLSKLVENWPDEAKNQFVQAVEKGKPYHILFAGSTALGEGENSWHTLVSEQLVETFGESVFTFTTLTYDMNSLEFVQEGKVKELAEVKADLILLEPLVLKDNGVVAIEDTLANVDTMIRAVKNEKESAVVILQPPHPLENATWYPVQVEELENHASAQGYHFLNHWEAWPENVSEYLTEDRDAPNKEGHKIWADYLIDYLIAE